MYGMMKAGREFNSLPASRESRLRFTPAGKLTPFQLVIKINVHVLDNKTQVYLITVPGEKQRSSGRGYRCFFLSAEADNKRIANMRQSPFVFLFVVLISFTAIISSCKKDNCTTCPPPVTNCEYPPGNRNFTWRLDTVAWFPSTLGGVWAFSDTDAYVMGTIVDGKPPYKSRPGKHWDGKVWEDNINGTWDTTITPDPNVTIKISPRNDVIGDDHFMVAVGYHAWTGVISAGIAEFDNSTKKWKSYQLQAVGELYSVWTDGKGYFIAVGDNGMVYTKDGYSAGWVYQKAPSGFNLVRVSGISKSEIYILGDSAVPGRHYQQIWKLLNSDWIKLYDNFDTTNTPIQLPVANDDVNSIAAVRCSISDSLYLYTVGEESYEFSTKENSLVFEKVNLASKGLPLSSFYKPAANIRMFSPNDYWISSAWYYLYHWNGSNFQKIEPISTLPYGEPIGVTLCIQKNSSGKIWMVLEMDSQVYAVLQGTP